MNYTDFRKRLVSDPEFANKYNSCGDIGDMIKAAAEDGYIFTEEDVKNETELLLDDLLDDVSGGDAAEFLSKQYTF